MHGGSKAKGKGGMKSPAKVQKELEALQKMFAVLAADKHPAADNGGKPDKGIWACKNPQCLFDKNFI